MPRPPRKRKPKPPTRTYPSLADRPPCDASLRVSMDILDRLRAESKRRHVWIRMLVEDAITEYLDKLERESSPPQARDDPGNRRAA